MTIPDVTAASIPVSAVPVDALARASAASVGAIDDAIAAIAAVKAASDVHAAEAESISLAKASVEVQLADLQSQLDAKASVEVRVCGECNREYAELVGVASTLCYSCRWLGAQVADTGLAMDRSLRHDTPPEVGIAALCHEAARSFAQLHGERTVPSWADAPAWLVASETEQAQGIIANPTMTPEDAHEAWRAARVRDGWVYGPQFNPINRVHPDLVPWAQLNETARTKARLFVAITSVLLGEDSNAK